MSEYSPFDVGFGEIEPSHLTVLQTTTEGWYVEYKREVPNAGAIAKSVSAMANTYGGWIFYGVDEQSKDNAVAGAFPGVAVVELDASLQKLRHAAASHLHPTPHFDTKVLVGPCDAIGLAAGRAVLCVRVPYSRRTPHLHKNGVIYRRVGDSSEPRPETDRFALDQLWGRSKELDTFYERWVSMEPEFSESEAEAPYLRLLIVADINRDRGAWLNADIKEVRRIMGGDALGIDLPFEMVHTTSDGFVARQVNINDPSRLGLTWWLSRDLRSEIIIPINQWDMNYLLDQQNYGYLHAETFANMLRERKLHDSKIIDLNIIYWVLAGIMKTQQKIVELAEWDGMLWFKIQLLNVWRTVPFIDSDVVIDGIKQHGMPVCFQRRLNILPGTSPSSFLEVPNNPGASADAQQYLRSAIMVEYIAQALGLPSAMQLDESSAATWIGELYDAGERARNAQTLRAPNS